MPVSHYNHGEGKPQRGAPVGGAGEIPPLLSAKAATMSKRTSDTTYRRNRAQLLAGQPTCHWCKRRTATEADHLIEHDRGGTDDLDNLVPSCKPCNAKRGQRYLEAKNRTRQALRARATNTIATEPKTLLESDPPRPPTPILVFIHREPDGNAGERS